MIEQVIHGDCIKKMQEIPAGQIDMILCDLPYAVTARQKWDTEIPLAHLWHQYGRIIKNNGAIVLTAVEPFRSRLIISNFKLFRYDLIWEKNKTFGFLNANKQPLRKHESILVFYKKQPTYNPQKTVGHKPVNKYTKHSSDGYNYGETKRLISGGGQTDRYPISILRFPVVNNDSKEKYHSAQKPVCLFEWLINTYSNPGDLILDNCAGSGTTLVAAKKLKRQFIGIDIDEKYIQIINNRLNEI